MASRKTQDIETILSSPRRRMSAGVPEPRNKRGPFVGPAACVDGWSHYLVARLDGGAECWRCEFAVEAPARKQRRAS